MTAALIYLVVGWSVLCAVLSTIGIGVHVARGNRRSATFKAWDAAMYALSAWLIVRGGLT